ncbi:Aerobic cobaltochelatase CobN subunit [Halomicronema hongdechloris C2206]|uniref:Aerobic cobaltochelatase CobN subunit n=1 Tax=Halomicronema hongdechloris C2206 TaxID=1641165 RepID=A0A1Z3HUT0_9CYAN|nr:cobaltochelatase subunit CobN [Halomicronema hongdechloris]ASC74049.1 Aerobic cobaltochelatase CobN subunit [Halomicronema hongdechloris C2206]
MHRLAATPGGWTPDTDGVIFIEQTPAPVVFITAADSEIQTLARVTPQLPSGFPQLRGANLLQLKQPLTIDTYADQVLAQAQLIILRLLGGRAYWSYGLEVVKEVVDRTGAALIVLPGDDRPDPDLISHSTVSLTVAHGLWRYLVEGGLDNVCHGLLWICDRIFGSHFNPPDPQPVPKVGLYPYHSTTSIAPATAPPTASIGLLFYRAHYLAGNTAPIDALCQALERRGLRPLPIYVATLQDPEVQAGLLEHVCDQGRPAIDGVINTTSFSLAKLESASPRLDLWQTLDVPVLQAILSGGSQELWQRHPQGLSPRDMAMNVALPEVDGRIITRLVSCKAINQRNTALETDVVTYEPIVDRIDFVADLAANWAGLGRTPPEQQRIALILANYPNRDGRLANGVGLDTPQSVVELLQALRAAGYRVDPLPSDGDELIQWLTDGISNDPEGRQLRPVRQSLSGQQYQSYFQSLPETVQQALRQRWGDPLAPPPDRQYYPVAGLQLGHVFVGIQPSRGYDADPSLNYHAPDLEPSHDYLAFYHWLRQVFRAQALVHVGKHGNLEWLPGKGIALSHTCYPEVALGPLPHLYPFIVNDPGEGAQAKRRSQAVILDHLTPPLTRAELYGPLQALERLVDEYYEAQSLDPTRLPVICDRIVNLLRDSHLLDELPLDSSPTSLASSASLSSLLPTLDAYLCDLKEAQIRDGLHILGRCPAGRLLRDLVVAIARHPSGHRRGLTRAIADTWGLDLDPLSDPPAQPWQVDALTPDTDPAIDSLLRPCRIVGDVVEVLEQQAAAIVAAMLASLGHGPAPSTSPPIQPPPPQHPDLVWMQQQLLPALIQTPQEITHLLRGLGGHYVPSVPSGAPSRNRPDVLPTGRNFYAVDLRAIPSESAWDVGRRAAEELIERYLQDHGDYPQTLGLSVWGTATMRTGGDDLAEALALLGVRPIWDGASRRVVDFEILPLSALGRPRVDVTLRISGFFRDAFANLIDLFDQAAAAVAALAEPPDQNPLAQRVQQEAAYWQQQGLPPDQAQRRASYRVFGSKPGAYGAGLQGLIDAQNWQGNEDLARAYVNWSSYAYGHDAPGRSAPEAFTHRLSHLQVVLHNQDNREHDLLDSDDYYQFQGGLTAAVRAITGRNPQTYFGDHSRPETPRLRSLSQEIARVYRSRVVNPKWIAGVMRHGYKGAFEMAATVDYLFAYDATAQCVADHIYEGVAQAYLLDPQVQAFVRQANPWALRDMAERLIEAHQRGLWPSAMPTLLDALRSLTHSAEETIETRHGPSTPRQK